MIPDAVIHYSVFAGFLALLGWAVVSDLVRLTIPNSIPILLVVLFAMYAPVAPDRVDWLGGLLVAVCVFAVGVVLFRFRLMGGGDVKLMSAVALWAGPHTVLGFLVVTSIAGGALALIVQSPLRILLGHAVHSIAGNDFTEAVSHRYIPYGAAIAAGGAFVALTLWAA